MLSIFANGFYKSGNYALIKACELLGLNASVNHVKFSDGIPKGTTHSIFIKRDPRNVIISMLRFQGKQVTSGTFLAKFRLFENDSFINELSDYEGWLSDSKTFVITFENLISNASEIKKLSSFLNVAYIDGAFESLPGYTITWTGKYSNFNEIWTSQLEDIWNNEGGNELLKRWGY